MVGVSGQLPRTEITPRDGVLVFTPGAINSSRDIQRDWRIAEREFYLHLLGHDVIIPGIHLAFFSVAHASEHVDVVMKAFIDSFEDLRADGLI